MTKKIISVALCALFLFNISGYYIVFNIMQHQARKEMKTLIKSSLSDDEMEIIIIPDSEMLSRKSTLRFIKKNEFMYKGKLYDIVKRKRKENSTVLYCINDSQEERLFAGLDNHIKWNTDTNSPSKSRSAQITKSIIKEATTDYYCYTMNLTPSVSHYNIYSDTFQEIILPLDSPPPEA